MRELRIVHAIVSGSQEGYESVPPVEVPLRLIDAGVLISPTSLTLAEPDGTDSYDLVLTSQPSADVVVTLILSGDAEANQSGTRRS